MNLFTASKKQEQFKKFAAKDSSFLKKIIGGEGGNPVNDGSDNISDKTKEEVEPIKI